MELVLLVYTVPGRWWGYGLGRCKLRTTSKAALNWWQFECTKIPWQDPLLSAAISSCCSVIMHGPMLQCTQYLEAENIPFLAWPSYSPDMSRTEPVWDALDCTTAHSTSCQYPAINVLFQDNSAYSTSVSWYPTPVSFVDYLDRGSHWQNSNKFMLKIWEKWAFFCAQKVVNLYLNPWKNWSKNKSVAFHLMNILICFPTS